MESFVQGDRGERGGGHAVRKLRRAAEDSKPKEDSWRDENLLTPPWLAELYEWNFLILVKYTPQKGG